MARGEKACRPNFTHVNYYVICEVLQCNLNTFQMFYLICFNFYVLKYLHWFDCHCFSQFFVCLLYDVRPFVFCNNFLNFATFFVLYFFKFIIFSSYFILFFWYKFFVWFFNNLVCFPFYINLVLPIVYFLLLLRVLLFIIYKFLIYLFFMYLFFGINFLLSIIYYFWFFNYFIFFSIFN